MKIFKWISQQFLNYRKAEVKYYLALAEQKLKCQCKCQHKKNEI